MINSISLEKGRAENLLPLIEGTELRVVALCSRSPGRKGPLLHELYQGF